MDLKVSGWKNMEKNMKKITFIRTPKREVCLTKNSV